MLIIYFIQPNWSNIQWIITDTSHLLYDTSHLNFFTFIPRLLLKYLAFGTLNSYSIHWISKEQDLYLKFVTLEDNLFSLAQMLVMSNWMIQLLVIVKLSKLWRKLLIGYFFYFCHTNYCFNYKVSPWWPYWDGCIRFG